MKLLWYSGKISDFHPAVPGSIPGGNFFKKSQIFLITRSFQKFWQKTWNQQLQFYYSMRRGKNWTVAPSSDSILFPLRRFLPSETFLQYGQNVVKNGSQMHLTSMGYKNVLIYKASSFIDLAWNERNKTFADFFLSKFTMHGL